MRKELFNALALLLSLLMGACGIGSIPCFAQQPAKTFRVPFHSVNDMILVDATVNRKPAALLLDTGCDATIVSPQAPGPSTMKLRTLTATKTTGANGGYVKARVNLRLAERHWIEREILVMDLREASKRLGTSIDGFVGQDLLRTFSAVRIDYGARFGGAERFDDVRRSIRARIVNCSCRLQYKPQESTLSRRCTSEICSQEATVCTTHHAAADGC